MVLWVAAAGALIGLLLAWNGTIGFVLGGIFGALMGRWLRHEIRQEIRAEVARMQLAEAIPAAVAEPWDGQSATPAERAAEPVQSEPAPQPLEAVSAPEAAQPLVQAAELAVHEPAEPTLFEDYAGRVRDWFLGVNTIVRVGLVILFIGLVFLARLIAARGWFPIEARLATVGLIGAALLGVGFAKRTQRPEFALHLQGGGVAVMYLTVFAAAKIYEVMPPGVAFAFMIVFAGLGAALAVMQNSQAMALTSFLGGFAVPVLVGGSSETPLGLFSYMTVLNLAVLGIAWKKSWRPLNLLGFFATVALASLWGASAYEDRHFLICEVFLAISVAIYLATAVLYAHNTPGKLGNFADSTLLFGTAITGFGMQAAMVQDKPYAAAWSALVFGAAYLGVTAWTMRRRDPAMRLLNESMLAIGVGFVTLAIPLALEARWTSAAWALEGAGAFWVGARQARWMPRAFGMALQVLAGLILIATLGPNVSTIAIANNGFVGPLLIALPVLFTAWLLHTEQPHSGSKLAGIWAPIEHGLRHGWLLAGLGFVTLALLREIGRMLPATSSQGWTEPVFAYWQQNLLMLLGLLSLMALADWVGRRRNLPAATWPGRASLVLIALCYLASLVADRRVLYLPDVLAWTAAIGLHLWLLRRQDAAAGEVRSKWNGAVHTMGALVLTWMVADCLFLAIDEANLWNTSWAGVVFLIASCAILALLTRWAGRAAHDGGQGLAWPLDPHARAYWWRAGLVLALLTWGGALGAAWFAQGISAPLPYLPLLNPIDLSVGLAFVALALWRQMLAAAKDPPALAAALADNPGRACGAVLAFVAINGIWVRTAHHFLGVPWDYTRLSNPTVLTGFSILWTLMAMGLMLYARAKAMRLPWLTGAALLGVVVAKLLLVDMSQAEGMARIVAFIGTGGLMLLIGYFVPLPPRIAEEKKA